MINTGIMLGNLGTKQIAERLEIDEQIIAEMEEVRQQKAEDIKRGKWHCFDMPFTILCGDKKTAEKWVGILSPHAEKFPCQIGIGWEKP